MGIYKVEIFCPRRVCVVSVQKKDPNASPPAAPAATPPAAPVQPTVSPAGSVLLEDGPPPDKATEEVIVTEKQYADEETGAVQTVDVTYAVKQITKEDDEKVVEEKKAQKAVSENLGTANDITCGSDISDDEDLIDDVRAELRGLVEPDTPVRPPSPSRPLSPPVPQKVPSSVAPAEPREPVARFAATPTRMDTADEESAEEDIKVEEELRDLLLAMIPGVRVTWNRCTSLMQSDDLDNMSVSFIEVGFYCKKRTAMHVASRVLDEIGIGKDFGRVAVYPVEFFRPVLQNYVSKAQRTDEERVQQTIDIAAMMQFEELLDSVDTGAQLSFDFVAFLTIAAIIAGAGLGADSAVSTVASMLVSPMMGPILATVLGTVLVAKGESSSDANRDRAWRLIRQGFLAEFFCLIVCVGIGICVGLGFYSERDAYGWGEEGTSEMRSRTSARGLIVGIVVAVPSGAGVALSLLGKNGNSLVGVAISASLLPPAVNCGMYLAFGVLESDRDLAGKGGISMALTLVNVVCIYVSALGTFYLKRALPQKDFDGRAVATPVFGVSNFDLAATGAIRGKTTAQTGLAMERMTLLGLRPPRTARHHRESDGWQAPPLRRVHTSNSLTGARPTTSTEPFASAASMGDLAATWNGGNTGIGGMFPRGDTWNGGGTGVGGMFPRVDTDILFAGTDSSSEEENDEPPRAAFDDTMIPSKTASGYAVPVLRRRRRQSH